MKLVKGYRYVKWPYQGLAAKLLLSKTALNGPVPCVPSPLAQACRGEDILYIFSNISWTLWVLDPITNPFLGPSSWLHPASPWPTFSFPHWHKNCKRQEPTVRNWLIFSSFPYRWFSPPPFPALNGNLLCSLLPGLLSLNFISDLEWKALPTKRNVRHHWAVKLSFLPNCMESITYYHLYIYIFVIIL